MSYKEIILQTTAASELYKSGTITKSQFLNILRKLEANIYELDNKSVTREFNELILNLSSDY